ncbi:MAG: beta strand repeat-containing protein [Microthrixaceae bacterium]
MFPFRTITRAVVAVALATTVLAVVAEPAYALGTVSVTDTAVTEGSGGSSSLSFVVSLSNANPVAVTVNYATSDGSAVAGSDYTATSGTVTIPAGEMSKNVLVPVTTDSFPEPNETLTLTLSNPSTGTSIGDGSAVGTISNDDGAPPALSVNDPSTAETDLPGSVDFIISLPANASQTITVGYATSSGTATSGVDFGASSGTATILAGASTATVTVPVVGDDLDEADETFTLTLTNPTNATILDGAGAATITDDDSAPTITSDAPTAGETDGASSLVFAVSLSAASGRTVTVDYATSNGTATAGTDYTAVNGTLIFSAGQVSKTVTVPITGDNLYEADETVLLNLTSPINATTPQPTATGTIVDDETAPAVSIADVTVTEGNSGTSNATVTVSLSAVSGQTVTVDVATTTTGTATEGTDFTASSDTLTFAPGITSRTTTVPVLGDLLDEANETVALELSNPVEATIGDGSGVLTINDNDATPTLTIGNATVTEGNSGTATVTSTLTLSAPSGRDVTVLVSTNSGTANGGVDFATQTGTLITIAAGSTTANVPATVFGDVVDEANETFTLDLSGPSNADIADGTGLITITDDDNGPSLSINNVSELEGNGLPTADTAITFTVTLSAASEQTATATFATADSTAIAGVTGDYDSTSGTLTFTPGQTSKSVTVNVNQDTHAEPTETFLVNLSAPTNATLSVSSTGVGTIVNDDGPPALLSVADVSAPEGNGALVVAATLSKTTTQDVQVTITTADLTAGADDYTAKTETLTIPAGQTSKTSSITVNNDDIDEPNETFSVTLSNARNAGVDDGVGTMTITDDDATPSLSIADVAVAEGSTGSVPVSLSHPSSQAITVDVTSADGTATSADYTPVAAQASFAAGETTASIPVETLTDALAEGDETLTLSLNGVTGSATIADGSSVVTITDGPPSISIGDATVAEGATASVPLTLTAQSSQTVTVRVTSTDGTATTGDYTPVDTVVSFSPGTSTAQVSVDSLEDNVFEGDETVTLTLSDPTAGTIGDGTATLTISDDETQPTISVGNATVTEGDSGNTPAAFAVTLSGPSTQTITVKASTAHGTTNGSDLTPLSASVITFAPGDVSETATVQVTGDTAPEANETYSVTLADPTNATIADGTGAGAITDDDGGGTYTPVTPTRILDTRNGTGRPGTSKVPDGQTVVLDVTGVGGVPASGVSAVAVNVTVTGPTGPGYIRATPSGGGTTSNLNYTTGQVIANMVIVPVGADGSIRLLTTRSTHIIADVFGWFAASSSTTPGSHFTSLTPTRLLDTRNGTGVPGGSTTQVAPGTTKVLDVTGVGGVPASGVTAVVLNFTVTRPTSGGFLSVTPNGGTTTSNINYATNETIAGLVVVPVGANGSIRYAVGGGSAHVIADVLGWFATPGTLTGSVLTTVAPSRLMDTRQDPAGPFGPQEEGFVPVTGEGGVPADGVSSAILNLTVTAPTAASYLAVTPDGGPGTSTINFTRNKTIANLTVARLDPDLGEVVIYNDAGFVHVIVDVFAGFSTPAP